MKEFLIKETCEECGGSGVVFLQTSSFLGLIRKQVPATCSSCGGKGYHLTQPQCKYCEGRGLIGNEREVCRACNGTGYGDQFRWIPRSELKLGRTFQRNCLICKRKTTFEIITPIESKEEVVSWEEEESLRKRRTIERVKVQCNECHDSYWVEIDPDFHPELSELSEEERETLVENELIISASKRPTQPTPF